MRTENRAAPPDAPDDTALGNPILLCEGAGVKALVGGLDKVYAALEKPPLPDSYWKARREWYQQEICMGGCDHHSPSCVESDRITECMKDMPYKLRLEMNEAVPTFRSQREHDEYWADLKHASGEEVRR